MAESAALLVDEVLPEQPIRQWLISFPFQLRFLFASRPELMGRVLGIVHRAISAHLIQKAGFTRKTAQTGEVTLIQRFGGALNLNVHFHRLFSAGLVPDQVPVLLWCAQACRSFGIGQHTVWSAFPAWAGPRRPNAQSRTATPCPGGGVF